MSDAHHQTEPSLRADLSALGIESGMVLTVHSSLSSIGWVEGGAATVVRSLLGVLGDAGTLAMPAATPQLLDPAAQLGDRFSGDRFSGDRFSGDRLSGDRPSGDRIEARREEVPIFDRATTPTALGAIPEGFRTWPGTLRSDHPIESVCARGPLADEITASHPLAFSEGEGSPFARLHELDSRVLLLGVGFNRCTALHFAESLVERRRVMQVRFPLLEDGRRVWVEHPNVADDNDTHFPEIGQRYLATGRATRGVVGEAESALCSMRDLVAFARGYFDGKL